MSVNAPYPKSEPPRVRWSMVWPILQPWRWCLAGAVLSVVLGSVLSLLPPLALRRLIDDNLAQGRAEGLFLLALYYLLATISVHLTTFVTAYTASIAAQGALRRLRVRLFEHLTALPISYYDHTPIGDAISRCTSDMATIDTLFSSGVISVLSEALRLVAALAAMITLSPPLSLLLLLALPILVVITRQFQRHMRDAQRALRAAVGRLTAHLQEILTRLEVVRALNWEHRIVQRLRATLADTLRYQNRSIAIGAVYDPLLKILQAALVAGFLSLSVSPWLEAMRVSVGTLTAFILLFDQFFGPLLSIGRNWQTVQGAMAGLERVFGVLTLPTDADGAPEPASVSIPMAGTTPIPANSLVRVERVTFGYAPDVPVLREVDLDVAPGQHLAIVGRTGAGKSSLFSLLGGLYRPWKGRIRLDGLDPSNLSPDQRRRILGAVPQEVWLYSGTILENLLLGDERVERSDAIEATRLTGADVYIERLPNSYDTVIGDSGGGRGTQLSAGQRQLLALSRALVGSPRVLLLDEATAAVDAATEMGFRAALNAHLRQNKGAVVTIAHRLSTAMEADRIIVLQDGRVVEEGAPQELLERGGHLASLWELENAGWEWRDNR